MTLTLVAAGEVYGVPKTSGSARGKFVMFKGTLPVDINDAPVGILMDDVPTNDPPLMMNAYGNGSEIDDSTLTLDENSLLFSNGDGTYTTTKPAGAAGTKIWVVGQPLSATKFRVSIYSIERGA